MFAKVSRQKIVVHINVVINTSWTYLSQMPTG